MNLKKEKKIMFLQGELNPHPLWSGQVWSGQNQMKNVKHAAN